MMTATASPVASVARVTVRRALERRGLERDGYVLFLSRVTTEKGVDDLIDGYAASATRGHARLVVAGTGPALDTMRDRARRSAAAEQITFLDDVDDREKWSLMAGCAAFVLPSKPRPEFVETFGIALVEKMLAGGGPVITTATGGILEAVGDTATIIPTGDPLALAAALDHSVLHTDPDRRRVRAEEARAYALQFDRLAVLDRLLAHLAGPPSPRTRVSGALRTAGRPRRTAPA